MQRSRLITIGIAALLLLAASPASPAGADDHNNAEGWASHDGGGRIDFGARMNFFGGGSSSGGSSSGGSSSGGSSGSSSGGSSSGGSVDTTEEEEHCLGLWGWEVPACMAAVGAAAGAAAGQLQANADPVDTMPPPIVIAEELRENLSLPTPRIRTSPTHEGGSAVVGLPTWFWIDPGSWQTVEDSVSVTGVTVSITAEPIEVTWSTGDGGSVTCNGPGTPYNPGVHDSRAQSPDCGYVYKRASTGGSYTVRAAVRWEVAYRVSGAPGGGPLPDTTLPDTISLRVVEVQTLN